MSQRPIIAYHRGRHGTTRDNLVLVENTLPAFEAALNEGSKIIELDLEREMLISHDAEIPHGAPNLKEVLDLVRGRCMLNVEIKSPLVIEALVNLIRDTIKGNDWKPEHFVISTFDHNVLLEVKKHLPNIRLGALMEAVPLPAYVDLLAQKGINNIHIEWRSVMMDIDSGYQLRAAIKKNNMEIWVYTVNSKSIYDALVKYGVDVIFTDKPELFK